MRALSDWLAPAFSPPDRLGIADHPRVRGHAHGNHRWANFDGSPQARSAPGSRLLTSRGRNSSSDVAVGSLTRSTGEVNLRTRVFLVSICRHFRIGSTAIDPY